MIQTVFKSRGSVVKIAFYFSLISNPTGYQVHALIPDLRGERQAFFPSTLDQHVYDV